MDKDKVIKLLEVDYKLSPIEEGTDSLDINPKTYVYPITPTSFGQIIFLKKKLALVTKYWGSYSNSQGREAFSAFFSVLESIGANSTKKAEITTVTSKSPNLTNYKIHIIIGGRTIEMQNVELPSVGMQTMISETIISDNLVKQWEINRTLNK